MGLKKHAKGQKAHGNADDASEGEGRQPHFVKNFTKSRTGAFSGVLRASIASGLARCCSFQQLRHRDAEELVRARLLFVLTAKAIDVVAHPHEPDHGRVG